MGDITEKRMRHYTGADADKDSIPAGGKSPGDSYHGNDSKKQYYWNGTAWKTGLGYEYIPISIAVWDWSHATLTLDGAWHVDGLDFGAKGVPVGAVAAHVNIKVKDDAAGQQFAIRPVAGSEVNGVNLYTQVANIESVFHGIMRLDADLLADYYGVAGLDAVYIAILGYFI